MRFTAGMAADYNN